MDYCPYEYMEKKINTLEEKIGLLTKEIERINKEEISK